MSISEYNTETVRNKLLQDSLQKKRKELSRLIESIDILSEGLRMIIPKQEEKSAPGAALSVYLPKGIAAKTFQDLLHDINSSELIHAKIKTTPIDEYMLFEAELGIPELVEDNIRQSVTLSVESLPEEDVPEAMERLKDLFDRRELGPKGFIYAESTDDKGVQS